MPPTDFLGADPSRCARIAPNPVLSPGTGTDSGNGTSLSLSRDELAGVSPADLEGGGGGDKGGAGSYLLAEVFKPATEECVIGRPIAAIV